MLDIDDSMLTTLKSADYDGFIRLGIEYSDVVIKAEKNLAGLENLFQNGNKVQTIDKDDDFTDSYFKLYKELVG